MAFTKPDPLDAIRAAKRPPLRNFGYQPAGSLMWGQKPKPPATTGGAPEAPSGPTLPQGGGGNPPQVQTTINPTPIYSPAQTNQAVNQAFADAMPDYNSVLKMGDRPGVSRSAGSVAGAMPLMAEGALTAMKAQAEIPLQDLMANQQHMMGGEVAREQQAQDLASLLHRQSQGDIRFGMGQQQQNMSLFEALVRGVI